VGTLCFAHPTNLSQIFVQGVGWVKEQRDVPTAVPMLGGHALLCPPYKFILIQPEQKQYRKLFSKFYKKILTWLYYTQTTYYTIGILNATSVNYVQNSTKKTNDFAKRSNAFK
jgi:hypothetical protein